MADTSPRGRLRLDGLAAYIQDIADLDATSVDMGGSGTWVVRRTVLQVIRPAVLREDLDLTTFCSGHGSHYAERRTIVKGSNGAYAEAAAIWVHVDARTGRPLRIPERFDAVYGTASGGRRVNARLHHRAEPPASTRSLAFPLRFSDVDVVGHVNNTVYWQMVEEAVAGLGLMRGSVRAEVEFRAGLASTATPILAVEEGSLPGSSDAPTPWSIWVLDGATSSVAATARLWPSDAAALSSEDGLPRDHGPHHP